MPNRPATAAATPPSTRSSVGRRSRPARCRLGPSVGWSVVCPPRSVRCPVLRPQERPSVLSRPTGPMIGRLRRLGAFDGGQDQVDRLFGVADHGHVVAEDLSLSGRRRRPPWPARLSAGIVVSLPATRYQLGTDLHAGTRGGAQERGTNPTSGPSETEAVLNRRVEPACRPSDGPTRR